MHDCVKGGGTLRQLVLSRVLILWGTLKLIIKCTHIDFVAGAYANFNDVYMYMYMNCYYTGGVASNKFLIFTCM